MGKMAIKRMLILNPGSPREMAAKGRLPQSTASGYREVAGEQKRRSLFNPKKAKPKKNA